jgi:hypothetical protein
LIFSGETLIERIERLKETVNIDVTAVIVIADCMTTIEDNLKTGAQMFEEKYGANAKVAIKIWILLPSWWS